MDKTYQAIHTVENWCNGGCFDCDGEPCNAPDGICERCGSDKLFISANEAFWENGDYYFMLECRDCGWSC